MLVLLAIHKNWNRSILGVVPSINQNTIGNFTVQIWFWYQPVKRISGSIKGTTLKTTKIHATYNDYSCLLINTDGITPWFACHFNSRYIGPLGWSGKVIRGFPEHLPGLGRQLWEIEIEIRFIVQVCLMSMVLLYKSRLHSNKVHSLFTMNAVWLITPCVCESIFFLTWHILTIGPT